MKSPRLSRAATAAALSALIVIFGSGAPGNTLFTAAAQAAQLGPSGLPLPRFVSIKSSRVNMRVGPGRQYHVDWMFQREGLPVEIIQEFDNWRKVRDSEGAEGWMLQSMLTGKRTALAAPWLKAEGGHVPIKADPRDDAAEIARMEAGVIADVEQCAQGWCRVRAGGVTGYAEQLQLWGVYPDETVD